MGRPSRREFTQLSLVFLAATILRIILGAAFNAPSIFTDEYQYVEMARSLPLGKGLYWDFAPTQFPCWLYTIMIAPFINLMSWENAYTAIRTMNAALVALTVLPAYGLARELAGHRRALGAAVLAGLLAGGGYSPTIMTESLFLPVFTLAIWTTYRAVLVPTAWRRLLAGLACGVAFHVKPHAMLLPLTVAATVAIFEADRLRDGARPGRSLLAQYLAGVGRHWLTGLGWVLAAIVPRIALMLGPEHYPLHPFVLKNFLMAILGSYTGLAEGSQNYSTGAMALSLGRYLLAWSWSAGLLPAWFLAVTLAASLQKKEKPATRLLALLTAVSTAGMLMLVGRHTLVTNPTWVLHERYYFVVLPAALCLFCARVRSARGLADGRWLIAVLIPLVAAFCAWCFLAGPKWTLPTSAPSFTGVMFLERPKLIGPGLIALYLLLIGSALTIYFYKPGGFKRQFTTVALLFIACNTGWYAVHGLMLSTWREEDVKLARKIDHTLQDDADQLLILKDGLTRAQTWHFGIRNPGLGVFLNKGKNSWWEAPLKADDNGQIDSPYPVEHTWLVAANNWKFNRKPAKTFDTFSLYRLSGEAPLRLDPSQLAAFRNDKISSAALNNPLEYTKNLNLKPIGQPIPPAMAAGQPAHLTLKLRNAGDFTLPGGNLRLALGYRWSTPARPGDAMPTHGDTDSIASVPAWVEPGEEFDLELTVTPPATPAGEYLLSIEPIVILEGEKQPVKTWISSKAILSTRVKIEGITEVATDARR